MIKAAAHSTNRGHETWAAAHSPAQRKKSGGISASYEENRPQPAARRRVETIIQNKRPSPNHISNPNRAQNVDMQDLTPGVPAESSNSVIQRTLEDARRVASSYYGQQFIIVADGLLLPNVFTPRQIEEIENARAAVPLIHSNGRPVEHHPLTEKEYDRLQQITDVLRSLGSWQYEFLNLVETTIVRHFGITGRYEFYRGAHLVFNDGGRTFYEFWEAVRQHTITSNRARPQHSDEVITKTEAIGSPLTAMTDLIMKIGPHDAVLPPPGIFTEDELAEGGVVRRSPSRQETSHYHNESEQLGVDLPSVVGGHILFGLTTENDTFVQSEGAGFQNEIEHVIKHGMGFIYNQPMFGSWQTGLIGYSRASEKQQTHIIEPE